MEIVATQVIDTDFFRPRDSSVFKTFFVNGIEKYQKPESFALLFLSFFH